LLRYVTVEVDTLGSLALSPAAEAEVTMGELDEGTTEADVEGGLLAAAYPVEGHGDGTADGRATVRVGSPWHRIVE